jgi:hypothetical protein
VRINYYPPRGDDKEGWDNLDIFGWLGYPMQIKVDFLCRDSILAAPIVLDLALFLDLAHRAGASGVQDWLSFYLKAPQGVGSDPVTHDLFAQQARLFAQLRAWRRPSALGSDVPSFAATGRTGRCGRCPAHALCDTLGGRFTAPHVRDHPLPTALARRPVVGARHRHPCVRRIRLPEPGDPEAAGRRPARGLAGIRATR